MNCITFSISNVVFIFLGLTMSVWASIVIAESKNSILLKLLENADVDTSADDLSYAFNIVCIFSIVVGVFIFCVAILGFCAANKEQKCGIVVYIFCSILITMLALAFAIIAFVFAERVHEDKKHLLKSMIIKEYTEKQSDSYTFSEALNNAQVSLKCCGIDGYTDFNKANKWDHNNGTIKIPLTCCILKNPDGYYKKPCAAIPKFATCQTAPTDTNSYYKKGCADVLMENMRRNSLVVGGLWLGVMLTQFFCIAFSCCLCRSYGDTKA